MRPIVFAVAAVGAYLPQPTLSKTMTLTHLQISADSTA
jgi:hypothetical protein